MRLIVVFFVFGFSINLFAKDSVDSTLYKYAIKAPDNIDLHSLVKYLKSPVKTQNQTVEIFFYWIGQHISYDYDLLVKSNKTEKDVCADSVYKKRKSICDGYCNLFCAMCNDANIECININGIGQNYTDNDVDTTNHAWNAVKLNEQWKLIDVTWCLNKATGEIDARYLFGDPQFFLIDHFPEDSKWQLTSTPITKAQFFSKTWDEKRFRKFNNLLDDKDYQNYLDIVKTNGWDKN